MQEELAPALTDLAPPSAPPPYAEATPPAAEKALATDLSLTPDTIELRLDQLERTLEKLPDTLVRRIVGELIEHLPQLRKPVQTAILAAPPPPASPPPPPRPPIDWGAKVEAMMPGAIKKVWSRWLIVEALSDFRLTIRMIFDRRYRMSWTGTIIIVVGVTLLLTLHWWNPISWLLSIVPVVERLVDKAFVLIGGFLLYKALSRETQRYRAFLDEMHP